METVEVVKVKGKRGRPKRDASVVSETGETQNSIRNVIEDELLSPYKIFADDTSYTVVDKEKSAGALMEKTHGYYTSLGSALIKIAKLKMVQNKSFTLPEYVREFEGMLKAFRERLDK